MHFPLIYLLVVKVPCFSSTVEHTHKSASSHTLQKSRHLSSLYHSPFLLSLPHSFFTITFIPPTPSFLDHHNFYLLPSIPSVLQLCAFHLTCKPHAYIVLFWSSLKTGHFSLRLPIFHIPTPIQKFQTPPPPLVILQAMFVHCRMRCCTFIVSVGLVMPSIINCHENLWKELFYWRYAFACPTDHSLQTCGYPEVLTDLWLSRGTYRPVAIQRYLQTCGYPEVLTDLWLSRGIYRPVAIQRYLQTCGYPEVLTDLWLSRGTYRPVAIQRYLQTCGYPDVLTNFYYRVKNC